MPIAVLSSNQTVTGKSIHTQKRIDMANTLSMTSESLYRATLLTNILGIDYKTNSTADACIYNMNIDAFGSAAQRSEGW